MDALDNCHRDEASQFSSVSAEKNLSRWRPRTEISQATRIDMVWPDN